LLHVRKRELMLDVKLELELDSSDLDAIERK
jgi:hypothetical protein